MDAERRTDELAALRAIYGEDQVDVQGELSWFVRLGGDALLEVHLPLDYPSHSPPTPVLVAPGITDEQHAQLLTELVSMHDDGAEVVFAWVEHLREALSTLSLGSALTAATIFDAADAADAAEAAEALQAAELARAMEAEESGKGFTFTPATSRFGQRTRHFDGAVCDEAHAVDIVTGAPFHPPKSGASELFQAHVARVRSLRSVEWVQYTLLQDRRIARATHNMVAYRFWDAERGVQVHDCDDDGESTAGRKLAELLEHMRANDVIVVVSRWFGGQLLGPARFKHIANTARELLDECGCGERDARAKETKPSGGSKGGGRHR